MDKVVYERNIAAISLLTIVSTVSVTHWDNTRTFLRAMELLSIKFLFKAAYFILNDLPHTDFARLVREVFRYEMGSFLALFADVLCGIALGNMIGTLIRR
ncbi:hypothetical protein [Endozoicomonas sp. SESOKO1]|uniref:hypothetical protein n=1 Tax=Endozoicomonas sp. SESOKO1 TaxID=2828742 RepID=UPI002147A778|nr:hypothetical protein [Endozoicomonas sp. SESOKO1]